MTDKAIDFGIPQADDLIKRTKRTVGEA